MADSGETDVETEDQWDEADVSIYSYLLGVGKIRTADCRPVKCGLEVADQRLKCGFFAGSSRRCGAD